MISSRADVADVDDPAALRDFVETSSVGLHWVDPAGIILWANRADYEPLGYTRDEYIGQDIARFHADPDVIADIMSRLSRDERLEGYEARLRCKDGAIRTVAISSSVRRDAQGAFLHTRCFSVDVTDRSRRLTDAQLLATTLRSIGDAVISTDAQGRIRFMNRVAEELTGWATEEVVNHPLVEIFSLFEETTRARVENPVDLVIQHGRPVGLSARTVLVRRDGGEVCIDDSAAPIHLENGSLAGVVLVFRDVGTLRRAQARRTFLHDATGLLASSLDGEGALAAIARAAVPSIADVCTIELGARPAREPALLPASLSVAIPGAEGQLGTITMSVTGTRRQLTADDVALAEQLASHAGIALENARLYAEAQRAVRVRQDMLAIVSHDLRNPLGVVMMKSDLLLRTLPSGPGATQLRDDIEMIRRNGARMERLIRDLLDFTSIHSGTFAVSAVEVDAGALVADALDAMLPLATQRSLRLEGFADRAGSLHCDQQRILQVLGNLIGNAIKFTPHGGSIRIDARRDEDRCLFSVADSGAGIAPDQLPRIFDRYWHGEAKHAQGIGLGLFIARGIVLSHGGEIWVDSEVGHGSTFTFALPIAGPPRP